MPMYPIPAASLARIRAAYAGYEQIAQVVAEAMGIDVSTRYRLDFPSGSFITDADEFTSPNGQVHETVETT